MSSMSHYCVKVRLCAFISKHISPETPYCFAMTQPRLLVIQHDLDDALNDLAAPLLDAGLMIDTWCTFRSDAPEEPLESFDGVLSLGALASATDEDSTPWIRGEIAVLEQALARRMPILGVCFGAQLLARAAGGRVYRSPVTEIGWYEVDMAAEAAADPVLGSLGPSLHVFQSHYDTFDLPAEATVLGRTGELTEAFRIGDRAWAVQFHIEANPSLIYSWLAVYKDAMLKADVDIDELRRFTASYWREYRQASWNLATAFAGEVLAAKVARRPARRGARHSGDAAHQQVTVMPGMPRSLFCFLAAERRSAG